MHMGCGTQDDEMNGVDITIRIFFLSFGFHKPLVCI